MKLRFEERRKKIAESKETDSKQEAKKFIKELQDLVDKNREILEYWSTKHKDELYKTSGAFEFEVKILRDLDLPNDLIDKLDDEFISAVIEEEVEEFKKELQGDYPWIDDVALVGRMSGWLAIIPERDYSDLEDFISEIEDIERHNFYDSEDPVQTIKDAAEYHLNYNAYEYELDEILDKIQEDYFDIADDLKEIEKRIEEKKKELTSEEFWRNVIWK